MGAPNIDMERRSGTSTLVATPIGRTGSRSPPGVLRHRCACVSPLVWRAVMSLIERFPKVRLADPAFHSSHVGSVGKLTPVAMPFVP